MRFRRQGHRGAASGFPRNEAAASRAGGSGIRVPHLEGRHLSLNGARNSELNIIAAVVRPDGKIALTLAVDVTAFGLTRPELRGARKASGPCSGGVLALV
jgi:hypothetical protein